MAMFRLHIEPIKRSRGQQATGAAAYRAGETIRDTRTGDLHNHSRRRDVRHAEILLPSRFGEAAMEWARNRASLWNAAEAAEKRHDARVAREYEVALPPELTHEQRLNLARSFSRELADRYGVAVDLALHDPKPAGDPQNFHAHLLTTTREVTPTGLGAKAGLDMGAVPRAKQGLAGHSEEYFALRERWAVLTNQALREANVDARVDHRSLAAQGIDRKPLLHIPMEFYQLEQRGMPKEAAERLREEYRSRLAAHLERSAASTQPEHAGSQPQRAASQSERAVPQPERATPQPEHTVPQPQRETVKPRNAEEIRRHAVQAWLRMWSKATGSNAGQNMTNDATSARGRDDGQER
jgi:ATP-dependent exoDNAse (exonuclease V) alpha subunit